MNYDITIIKDILLRLSELQDNEIVSLASFKPEEHEAISSNVFQLLKNKIIVGSYFGAENNIADFSIGSIKNNMLANKFLLFLKKVNREDISASSLSELQKEIQKPLYNRLWGSP